MLFFTLQIMNYLAHAYLSFGHPEILVGNMISDFVKGKKKFNYAPGIQAGISLHREIDQFTDDHLITREAKFFFKNDYRLYSGAFVDVVFDHFLATDKNEFNEEKVLFDLSQDTYQKLDSFKTVFPPGFFGMFPYMKQQNWLYNYKHTWGIQRSFEGLVHRSAYLDDSVTAFHLFEEHYEALKNCYTNFFPDLKAFAFERYTLVLPSF